MPRNETNDDDDRFPKWIDDCHLDLGWIRSKLEQSPNVARRTVVTSCSTVMDKSNETRRGAKVRDGATLALTVTLDVPKNDADGVPDSPHSMLSLALMIKQVPSTGLSTSLSLGLAREAFFYQDVAAILAENGDHSELFQDTIPAIYYAVGDATTGQKTIIMDDLSSRAVDSAVFFAPTQSNLDAGWRGNPNLWNRNHEILTAIMSQGSPSAASHNIPSQAAVAKVTFQTMARIHAYFWRRSDWLLAPEKSWLRGHAWLQGRGQESWEASQDMIRQIYQQKTNEGLFDTALNWDPVLLAATHQAMQNISWQAHQTRLHTNSQHWTLVHGDFWPGNVLWMLDGTESDSSVRLIDWEMCGVGSGPQDLGQYVISNMEPGERRACERELIQAYFDELVKAGVEGVTFDYCWDEYRIGGVERWLWFLVYFVGLEGFSEWAQFFHNQIAAFMRDHDLTAANIGQPRP